MPHPGRPATRANRHQGPFKGWSFLHVDRVVPTAAISRGGAPVAPFAVRERAVLEVPVAGVSGYPGSVTDVLRDTETDAFRVLNDGVIVHESHPDAVGRNSRHMPMSVTKSSVGVVAGILADRGILDLDGQITDHVREVVGFGYEGASVRNLLDMFRYRLLGGIPEPRRGSPDPGTRRELAPAGARTTHGGLCATARDVARFGQLLLDDGRAASGEQVLPEDWTRDVLAGAADGKDAFAATSSFDTGMPGGHYRHQLWVPFAAEQVMLALGFTGKCCTSTRRPGPSASNCRHGRCPKSPPASTTPWPLSGRSLTTRPQPPDTIILRRDHDPDTPPSA